MRTQQLWLGLVIAAWTAQSTGCTAISNLDRFNQAAATNTDAGGPDAGNADASTSDLSCANPETLCVRLTGFTPHVDELVDVDLVTADHTLRARAILDPLGATTGDIVMPLAIPASEVPSKGAASNLHLEIWGDKSGDRKYTADKDHDWIEPLPASGKDVFMHNSAFTNLLPRPRSIGGDFVMNVTGMEIHKGKLFEVMVIEGDSGRTVGLYRVHGIPDTGSFSVTIPEIIDTGNGGGIAYRIEYWADANGSGKYEGVGPDHSWVTNVESDATGLHLTRPHSGPNIEFAPLSYQFPFEK
jgi:hypothetical protein